MSGLDKHAALKIIHQLGGTGQPPEFGVQYFSVGLEPYLDVIEQEYLSTFIKEGGSAFKLVLGIYGGGKTHFLYCVRKAGWDQGFAVSYVSLKSGGECPFSRLDLVYRSMVGGLLPPITNPDIKVDEVRGIENFLRYWYAERIGSYQERMSGPDAQSAVLEDIGELSTEAIYNTSFRNAIVAALRACLKDDERQFSDVCQWLKGESSPNPDLKKLGITHRIDRTTAFGMIRSLGQITRLLEYSGLVVLFDEAEQVPSLGRGQRDQLLSNLREFIDECGQSSFQGIMVFYAVPDRKFLEGRTQVYQALTQRLSTNFEWLNPTGVVIGLDDMIEEPLDFLCRVGTKIVPIYNTAYDVDLVPSQTDELIRDLAEAAWQRRYADTGYKRLFVQQLVKGLGIVHRQGRVPQAQELM